MLGRGFSSILLTAVLVLSVFSFKPVGAVWSGGKIYIRADGRVEPANAPITTRDKVTYILTDDVTTEGIVIERDNIILDGNGHTITGRGKGYGILLENRRNVVVRNLKIEKFDDGIRIIGSSNITITRNTITNNGWDGIALWHSSGNTITGNTITNNRFYGIFLTNSSGNTITWNTIANNERRGILFLYSSGNRIVGNVFWGCGLIVYYSYSNVVEGNSVNGRPLVYLENARDVVVRDAGQVVVVRSVRVRVENLNLSNTTVGVELWESSECTIAYNNITNNRDGIFLHYSNGVTVTGNTIANNGGDGIVLSSSSGNTITWNTIANNGGDGIFLHYSNGVTVTGNTIANNGRNGIYFYNSSGNRVFLNNFIGNRMQVFSVESVNVWDDGSRGNFWSDYAGRDLNNDGIGDTPYTIDERNVDRYPLIRPYEVFSVKVYSPYGTVSGSGWYEKGVKVTVSVSPVLLDHGNGTRCVFSGWYDERGVLLSIEPVFSLTVDKPLTVTARWDTEYKVEAYSPYGSATGSGWYKRGVKVTVSVSPVLLDHGNGTRRVFSGWYDEKGNFLSSEPVFSLTVDKPLTVTAKWDTEYRVEIYSPYGLTVGSGWYQKGSTATVSVSPATVDAGFFMEYVFEGWMVEGWLVSASPVYSFTVDRPVTLTARWVGRVKLANVFALLILAMLAVGLLWRSRVSTRVRRETRVVEGVASEEVETRVAVELERLKGLEEELEKVKMYLSKLEEEWKKGTISTDAYEILKKEYEEKIEQLENEINKIKEQIKQG
ncbi:MAG: NosD domain-containing protein [Thermofilaceae archaeon]